MKRRKRKAVTIPGEAPALWSYDDVADVLYITVGTEPERADDAVEDAGVIIRSRRGRVVSVTIYPVLGRIQSPCVRHTRNVRGARR